MNLRKVCALLLCAVMAVTSIPAGSVYAKESRAAEYDIYVSPQGNDETGNGTQENPYATVDRAREEARDIDGEVTVSVGEGKYFLDEPVVFGPEDSNVTYVGENAVLTGAKTLSDLTWTAHDSNIQVADVEAELGIDQLFIDGDQQVLARFPNYNAGQALQGCTDQGTIKARSANWSNPAGGYIRALHNYKWGGNSYKITGKNNSALGLSYEWVGDNNRGSGMHTGNIMVENIFEELDSPGEWFYDNAEGKLYVWPEEGTDLSNAEVEGAVTEELLHVEGVQDGEQVTNLTFDGLTLENTKRTMFTGRYIPLMRSDWCVVRSGALFVQDAEDVAFENGIIRNIGGNGVFISGHSENVVINNNEILNIGSSGVIAAGFPDSCREPSFNADYPTPEVEPYYIDKTTIEDPEKGPVREHYPEGAVISNNHIQNVGIWEKQSSQAAVSVAHNIKILHNTIHEGPRAGINVGDGTFGGHEIAYNDVFDVQRETDDHGMFNSWGRDRFYSLGGYDHNGNGGAAKEPYSMWDAIDTVKIHDNRMHFAGRVDGGSTFGIDLDDGSTNYDIYNNLCLNMGIKLREGFHRNVHNNILVNGVFNLHCTYEDSYDTIEKNIVVKGNPYSLAATNEYRFSVSEDVIDNNWFYDLGMKVNYPGFWSKLGYDVNSVNADPKFRDTKSNDYTVTNEVIMEQIGFENFPMDQFGKPGCEYQAPVFEKTSPDGNEDILEREEWLGATISALDDAIMSATASGSLDGVYLEEVPEGSQASLFGLQTKDVIQVVNGKEIGKKANFIPMYNAIEMGTLVNMKLVRNGSVVELNFVKSNALKETIVDDQDAAIKYSGGTWEEATPSHNPGNAVNCVNKTLKYLNMSKVTDKESVCVEVPFTGSRIEFISRKERNMGEYKIEIYDESGGLVQEAVCSADNGGNMADQSSIFKSNVFPEGNYTLKLKWKSGGYVIVDAFKVFSQEVSEKVPVVVQPITVTENGEKVTELVSGKQLEIHVPMTNRGAKAVNAVVSAAFSGQGGALKLEEMQKTEVTVNAGESLTAELAVTTPDGSESKRLEVYVYDKDSSQIYVYPMTLDGNSIALKDVIVLDAAGEKIEYTYTQEDNVLTMAAKGFAAGCQVLMQVLDGKENVIAQRQVTVSEAGQAKAAFILSKDFSGKVSFRMYDEKGTEKTAETEIYSGENILDKSALQAAVNAAKLILEDEENLEKYTKASWMTFYNAYMNALERLESNTGSQADVSAKANALTEAQNGLTLLAETKTFHPSNQNVGTLFHLYRADGTEDGGNRDGGKGDQWQVRTSQVDATVNGSYAEFKGNFTSFAIKGVNKAESANFKVIVTDDATGETVYEEKIVLTKNQNNTTVPIFETTGLSGKPQTVRVYHEDSNGYYMELREITYSIVPEGAEKIPELTAIEVTALPEKAEYIKGYEGEISLLGGELTETYSDGSTNVIPMNSAMYESGFDTAEAGEKTIVVAYRGQKAEFNVRVTEAPVEKTTYTVTVEGGVIEETGAASGEYDYNDAVTVKADTPETGKKFAGWQVDGVTVSTEQTYKFYVSGEMTLTAVYVDENAEVTQEAEALMTNVIMTERPDGKYDVKFVGQLVVPKGYKLQDAGLVWSSKDGTELTITNSAAKKTFIKKISNTNQFSVTIKGMPADKFINGRIFTTLEKESPAETFYSDAAKAEVK